MVSRAHGTSNAQGLFVRVPAEPLLFSGVNPKIGLSQRDRDRPRWCHLKCSRQAGRLQ
jgi:hypothetical protein